MQIAAVYAQRQQADEAFRWLEHALDMHDPGVTELYGTSYLNLLRDDPRFAAIAKKIGLPPLPAQNRAAPASEPAAAKPAAAPPKPAKP